MQIQQGRQHLSASKGLGVSNCLVSGKTRNTLSTVSLEAPTNQGKCILATCNVARCKIMYVTSDGPPQGCHRVLWVSLSLTYHLLLYCLLLSTVLQFGAPHIYCGTGLLLLRPCLGLVPIIFNLGVLPLF